METFPWTERKDGARRAVMAEKTTIVQIAALADVGIGTVSRVLNNHPSISPGTRERVMAVIREKGYIPNDSARDLKRESLRAIVVLVKGLSNTFFAGMAPVLQRALDREDYAVLMHQLGDREDGVTAALRICKEKKPRGLIFLGGHFQQQAGRLARLPVPFVMLTTTLNEGFSRRHFSSVSIDDFQAGYEVGRRVWEAGHRSAGVIAARNDPGSIGRLRAEGFLKALADRGLQGDQARVVFAGSYTHAAGHEGAGRLLGAGRCTCLFCVSDIIALGALRALHELGLKVPEDVSVIGFDGLVEGRYAVPSLCTVAQPGREMAELGAGILLEKLRAGGEHRHLVLSPAFIPGESFAPPKTGSAESAPTGAGLQ